MLAFMGRLLLVTMLLCLGGPTAAAESVRWSEIGTKFANRNIELKIDTETIKGKLVRVEGTALILTPKAEAPRTVERSTIRKSWVRGKGKGWRVGLLIWGGLSILGGAVEGGIGRAAGAGVMTLGAFVLGDYLDKRKFEFKIVD